MKRLIAIASVWTGCSYEVSFEDCEVSCQTSEVCPDGFTCMEGVCRTDGASGVCGSGGFTLRQTDDDNVQRSLVFGCTNSDGTTPDTSWYRVFSLTEEGVAGAFEVESVRVGVCFAVGTPEITVKVGTYAGAIGTLDLGAVTMLDSADVTVQPTQISKVIDVPVMASIPEGSNLVVEVATPDQVGTGQQMTIGVTAAGEDRPGFLRAPLCGTANPTQTTTAGVPDAHIVIEVTGTR